MDEGWKMPEIGGQLDTYCTKCKLDRAHRIVSMAGGAVKTVECQTCGAHHLYRRPKTERDAAQARTIHPWWRSLAGGGRVPRTIHASEPKPR
jgi:hypothetical protein